MDTQKGTKIKQIIRQQPYGAATTASCLLTLGATREGIRALEKGGWLRRIGVGAYALLDQTVSLDGGLYALQNDRWPHIHEGGFSALAGKHGKTHNLVAGRPVQLFSVRGQKPPGWFLTAFSGQFTLHSSGLLPPDGGLVEHDCGTFRLRVSGQERAMLEMLYLAPRIHTFAECFQMMELLVTLKPEVVQSLLEACSSIKTKRLFLYMADLAGHAWVKRLRPGRFDLGSGIRELEKGGTLVPEYGLVLRDVRSI
jgi:hypothetical protein